MPCSENGCRSFRLLALYACVSLFVSCKPDGFINRVKYEGEKYTNTCASFHEDVSKLLQKNHTPTSLNVSEYDNSRFDYYYLEQGQFEIKNDTLNFRLANDLDYATYLAKGVAIHLFLSSEPVGGLKDLQGNESQVVGTLVVDETYLATHGKPFMLYQIPVDPVAIAGRQLMMAFAIAQYDKAGHLEEYFCETDAQPLGTAAVPCCAANPWKAAQLQTKVDLPALDVKGQAFKYDKLSGTFDVLFAQGSDDLADDTTFDALIIQQYVNQYQQGDYGLESLALRGYASPEGRQANNQELSTQRALVLQRALATLNEDRSELIISAEGAGEDWERVRLLTKLSSLDEAQQAEVQTIIADSTLSLDQKETKLRRKAYWSTFFDEVFTPARHTEGVMDFVYEGQEMSLRRYIERKHLTSLEMREAIDAVIEVKPYAAAADPASGLKTLEGVLRETATPELYVMQATYHVADQDYQAAIDALEKAGRFRGGEAGRYQAAIQAYKVVGMNAQDSLAQRALLREFDRYLQRQPDDFSLASNRNILLEKIGYLGTALTTYENLASQQALGAAQLNNRAVAKIKARQFEGARADLKAAITKDPALAEAYFNLAAIEAYRGYTLETIEWLDQAFALNPDLKALMRQSSVFEGIAKGKRFDKYKE